MEAIMQRTTQAPTPYALDPHLALTPLLGLMSLGHLAPFALDPALAYDPHKPTIQH